MNKRYKNRIYTFVVGKRAAAIMLSAFFMLCTGIGSAYLVDNISGGPYAEFLKLCCAYSLPSDNDSPSVLSVPPLTADTLMKQTSPIFKGTDHAVPVFSPKKADMSEYIEGGSEINDEEKITDAKAGNVIERNIESNPLKITNATDYQINTSSLMGKKVTYNGTGPLPKVLIMHTHGCETYSSKDGVGLGEAGAYRTTDTDKNITVLGELLCSELKKNGINAIHDKTLCDYPSYNSAYKTALGLIDWYKSKYPSIEFVFDIHRDAIAEDDGTPIKLTCEIDGEKCAQVMIVCGTDKLGLSHPNWEDNLIFGLNIQNTMEKEYPGLMRPVNLREERFNMHMTKGSLIFEIGTHANTMDEAKAGIKYLSKGLSKIMLGNN